MDPFLVMQLGAWAAFVWLPLGLFAAGAWLRTRPRVASALVALGLADVAVGTWAFFVEPYRLEVTTIRVESDKVGAPFTIAVLADFQTDHIGRYETSVMSIVTEADPDVVLWAGDYIQTDARGHAEVDPKFNTLLRATELDAPLGMYAVMGNIDFGTEWERLFDGTGVIATRRTQTFDAGTLLVTALSFEDSFDRRLVVPPSDEFHVVFGHGPDFALGSVEADLLVAGHTHGGQVRMPFFGPPITFSAIPRAWAAGRTDLANGSVLVVSRGIGMERGNAPRLRLFCRPQIVLIEVVPR